MKHFIPKLPCIFDTYMYKVIFLYYCQMFTTRGFGYTLYTYVAIAWHLTKYI